jgi:hypothetical protein
MTALSKAMAISVAALMFLSAASFAMGDTHPVSAPGMPEIENHDNSIIVSNSKITVWFQGFKPVLHIFYRNQSNNTGFTIAVRGVYELNSTGVPVAVLSTVRAFPEMGDMSESGIFNYSSGVAVTYDNASQMVNITFNLTSEEFALGPLHPFNASGGNDNNNAAVSAEDGMMQPVHGIGQGSISVVFHVNESSAHVKFDLLVHRWTWFNNTGDRLALSVAVVGHNTVSDAQGDQPSSTGTEAGDSSQGNDNSQSGGPVANADGNSGSNQNGNSNDRIDIGQGSFSVLGYISWGSIATATYSNGTSTNAYVTVKMFNHGFEEPGMTHILFIFNVTAGWNTNYSSLTYDPTVGLDSTMTATGYALIGGIAAAAVLAGVAAVLFIRRR